MTRSPTDRREAIARVYDEVRNSGTWASEMVAARIIAADPLTAAHAEATALLERAEKVLGTFQFAHLQDAGRERERWMKKVDDLADTLLTDLRARRQG